MKNSNFLLITTLGMVLISCGQTSSKNNDLVNEEKKSQTQTNENISQNEGHTENVSNENLENKFLITNNSIGYFKIGGTWHNYAKNDYNYKSFQGYGTCIDACCDGGFHLGNNLIVNKYGQGKNSELTIGSLLFKVDESFNDENERNKYKNNKDVFYVSSDNCSGWYWKDKIGYLVTYSDAFKTKEGIGVGTSLEKVKEILGKVVINIGWIEEDANAIQITFNSYPNIKFILDEDDAIGGYEKLSALGGTAMISDFKKNTKIKRLIVQKTAN